MKRGGPIAGLADRRRHLRVRRPLLLAVSSGLIVVLEAPGLAGYLTVIQQILECRTVPNRITVPLSPRILKHTRAYAYLNKPTNGARICLHGDLTATGAAPCHNAGCSRRPWHGQKLAAISVRRRCALSRAARIESAGPVVGPIGTKRTLFTPMKRSVSRK